MNRLNFFFLILILGFFPSSVLRSQSAETLSTSPQNGLYDNDRLPAVFHKSRRDLVLDSMRNNSVALFFAAPERTRANDIAYLYHQDPNFYYLTGCLEPKAVLLLGKSLSGERQEILFVEPRKPDQETWTGKRLGPEDAKRLLEVNRTEPLELVTNYAKAYDPSTIAYFVRSEADARPFFDSVLRISNLTSSNDLSPVLANLRAVKTPEELRLMRRAIGISIEAHKQVLKDVRPGWYEYQIQALGEYVFSKNGAEYTAYPSIVGSGENSTILHYETNRRQTANGDFIEMDMGCEYHGYASDVTRSYPVNGKFTPEQRTIYELVKEAQDSGIRVARAGYNFREPHWAAVRVISRGLMRLGITHDSAEYFKYFMHGTSHYLGLDVHDAGPYGHLVDNNIITVEPGIYIKAGSKCDPKWWNIGCRIEDDILINGQSPVNLSQGAPRTIEAIEALMKH